MPPELRAKALEHDWTAENTHQLILRLEIIKELIQCPLISVAELMHELPFHYRLAFLGSLDGFMKIKLGV